MTGLAKLEDDPNQLSSAFLPIHLEVTYQTHLAYPSSEVVSHTRLELAVKVWNSWNHCLAARLSP